MKIALACALVVLGASSGASIGFEADGVRVGDLLVTDTALQLKDAGAGHVLVSSSVLEPLTGGLTISLAPERALVLEPGIRVARTKEGFSLTAHNRRRLEVAGQVLMTPVIVEVVEKGLRIAGGRVVEGGSVAVRRVQQDDVDAELKKMQEAAKKMQKSLQEKPESTQEERDRLRRKKLPFPPIFGHPFLRGEGATEHALLPLFEASPIGF